MELQAVLKASSHFWLYSKSLLRFSTSNTLFIVRVARLFKLRRLAPLVSNTDRPGIIVQQPHTLNMVPLHLDSNNINVWASSRKHRQSNYNNCIVFFNNQNTETTKVILIQEPKNHGLAAPTCSSRKQNVGKSLRKSSRTTEYVYLKFT